MIPLPDKSRTQGGGVPGFTAPPGCTAVLAVVLPVGVVELVVVLLLVLPPREAVAASRDMPAWSKGSSTGDIPWKADGIPDSGEYGALIGLIATYGAASCIALGT
eukprot:g11814.t1